MPIHTRRSTLPHGLSSLKKVMEMFLVNDMNGAEAECQNQKSTDQTLYIHTASSLMRSMRALMSFESDDIVDAQKMVQQTLNLANEKRLPMSRTFRLASFAYNASLSNVQQMDIDQLHSELIYAECLLEKAIMGFVSSGDWMSSLRKTFEIRSVVSIYRTLNTFLEQYDELVKTRQTPSVLVDADFRSGVYLGMGMSLLVFSMNPSRVAIFAGLLGYKGDRFEALRLLRKAGGWGDDKGNPDHNQKVPRVSKAEGGARRALCDLVLVIFHLVISGFTREGVDVKEAENIVEWNLKQYPGSIFFLFGKGRSHVTRSQPDQAIEVYKEAQTKVEGQRGYQQLGSVMDWEMALCNLALGDWRAGAESFDKLRKSAKWSKSIYGYGRAACLLQCRDITPMERELAEELITDVQPHLQRTAGRSIPLEKFVAHKAEQYLKERRLVVPALELAYTVQATNQTMLEALNKHKDTLEALTKTQLAEDDRQLVNLLLGVTLSHIENPQSEDALNSTVVDSPEAPRHYLSSFRSYAGASSQEPCAKRALIVSIEYLDGQTFDDGRIMYLPGCHADAADVLDLLRTKGKYLAQDIRILADLPGLPSSQKPTRENIIHGLRWLASGCLEGDRRFFYYIGHATQVEDLDGDEADGFDEAIQPMDWSTKYRQGNDGLIIDDEFRELLVDRLPRGSTLTALFDCCHSGTILDMEQETQPQFSRLPGTGSSAPSPSLETVLALVPKLRWPKRRWGVHPVGNILELPEVVKVKDSDEPVSPGADRGPIVASEYVVLEKKNVEGLTKRTYLPIVANVVCWSACLDGQLAWSQPQETGDDRGILTFAFTTGMRGAAAHFNPMPGRFSTEKRDATYDELFDYILTQERVAYEERMNYESIAQFYQNPQLWVSASMGDIMDMPVVL